MGNWGDLSDSTEPVDPDFLVERPPVIVERERVLDDDGAPDPSTDHPNAHSHPSR